MTGRPVFTGTVSTHSRPKAAADDRHLCRSRLPFQHTAARRRLQIRRNRATLSFGFNTQPPEGGCKVDVKSDIELLFQHTAARRRLRVRTCSRLPTPCFNTQPPEGGCEAFGMDGGGL